MIDSALTWFGRLHIGWKLILAFLALTCLSTIFQVWGERHFLREYFSAVAAHLVYWGRVVAGIGLGAATPQTIYDRTRNMWLGTAGFLVVCISVALTITLVFGSIPSVKRHLKAIEDNDCHTEYDGRSSWTEC